ncbi:hypothetical protein AB0P15_28855 [Streptomyces sp. NPDC087917]|uniref:hypothetical protein n=1 Tax=Streptomyces sp. NPDC087917 TaxID=3155060 RepID=UPI00343EB4CA
MLILLLGVCDAAGHHRLTSTAPSPSSTAIAAAPGRALPDRSRVAAPEEGGCHGGSRSVEEHTANKPDGEPDRAADPGTAVDSPEPEFRAPPPYAASPAITRADPHNLSCVDRR